MNMRLLSMRFISTSPRHLKRKRARFIHRGPFAGKEGAFMWLMVGMLAGVGLMKLLAFRGF